MSIGGEEPIMSTSDKKMVICGIEFDTHESYGDSRIKINVENRLYPCPKCGLIGVVAPNFLFKEELLIFLCSDCGQFEWQGDKA